jgi:hypothetical protein
MSPRARIRAATVRPYSWRKIRPTAAVTFDAQPIAASRSSASMM